MRNALAALVLCLVASCAPTAPVFAAPVTCAPVDAEQFVAEGVTAIQSGKTKGAFLGDKAAAFGVEVGVEGTSVAVFIIPAGDKMLLMVVGVESVCYGEPTDGLLAVIKKHFGTPA